MSEPFTLNDLPIVLQALEQTQSNAESVRNPAQLFLLNAESRPNFIPLLLEIVKNASFTDTARLMAVISMKNTVNRQWKQRTNGGISAQEKSQIRASVFSILLLEDEKLAIHVAVLISKIAREDFPNQWPDLVTTLVGFLSGSTNHHVQRGLLALYHVVKQLNSKRLAAGRIHFQQLAGVFLVPLMTMWTQEINVLFGACSGEQVPKEQSLSSYYKSNLCSKICRRLLSSGVQNIHENPSAISSMEFVRSKLVAFIQLKCSLPLNHPSSTYIDKTLHLFGKLILDVFDAHAYSLLAANQVIPLCEVYYAFLTKLNEVPNVAPYEGAAVHGMLFLKGVFETPEYVNSSDEYVSQLNTFWSNERINTLVNTLVQKFFLYTPQDLAEWQEDAEVYHIEQTADTWKEKLRPCAENLYATIICNKREVVGPHIAAFYNSIVQQAPLQGTNFNYVILKDACYNALGLGAYYLYDYVDFDVIFPMVANDATANFQGAHILRGRAAWLCGCWVTSLNTPESRAPVYSMLVSLLNDSDICTRLFSMSALKILIDDTAFYPDQFIPFLVSFMTSVFNILAQVNAVAIKQQILSSVSIIFEQVGLGMKPYIPPLMNALPILWQQAGDDTLLKTTILVTLQKVVQIMGSDSLSTGPFLLQVTLFSTNPKIPEEPYLAEDALSLLLAIARSALDITPELLEIFGNVVATITQGTEHLMTCIHIIESYLLLNPSTVLQAYGTDLIQFLSNTLGTLKDRPTIVLIDIIDILLKLTPSTLHVGFQPIFEKLITLVFSEEEGDFMKITYISPFSRLITVNIPYFRDFFRGIPVNAQIQSLGGNVLGAFLDIWIEKSDNIVHAAKRRLSAYSLCQLLMSGEDIVYQNIGAILNHCIEAIADSSDERLLQEVLLLASGEPDEDEEVATPLVESQRKINLYRTDVVFTVDLRQMVLRTLYDLEQTLGQTRYQALMQLVDPSVLAQLQAVTAAQ